MTGHPRPTFTWLGHATVRCDLPGGEVVLIDPFLTGNPRAPEGASDFERLDAILVTHAHFDHFTDVLELARKHQPLVVGTWEVCQWLAGKGVERASGMNLGGAQDIPGGRAAMVRADHSAGFLEEGGRVNAGVACGYVVRLDGGFTFYHAGDTALFGDMQLFAELWRPELAFLPIGDLFTMDPRQAARACRYLEVRKVIPIHWGTFDALTGTPDQLQQELDDLGVACDVIRLEPGESF